MRDTFDNELRSLLSDYERRVPETVWDGVSRALARRRLAVRRRRIWSVAAAAVAVVCLAVIMGGRIPFLRQAPVSAERIVSRAKNGTLAPNSSTKQELRRSIGECYEARVTVKERISAPVVAGKDSCAPCRGKGFLSPMRRKGHLPHMRRKGLLPLMMSGACPRRACLRSL